MHLDFTKLPIYHKQNYCQVELHELFIFQQTIILFVYYMQRAENYYFSRYRGHYSPDAIIKVALICIIV